MVAVKLFRALPAVAEAGVITVLYVTGKSVPVAVSASPCVVTAVVSTETSVVDTAVLLTVLVI
mgnify:CR=1 FL=1